MKSILGIETSRSNKKKAVHNLLVKKQFVTSEEVEKMQRERLRDKIYRPDPLGTIRTTFLTEIDESIIRKAQTEYFSSKIGNSFDALNRTSL